MVSLGAAAVLLGLRRGRRRRRLLHGSAVLHVLPRDVRELGEQRARQRAGAADLEATKVPGGHVEEGQVEPGLGVGRVVHDEVEEDEQGDQRHDAEHPGQRQPG